MTRSKKQKPSRFWTETLPGEVARLSSLWTSKKMGVKLCYQPARSRLVKCRLGIARCDFPDMLFASVFGPRGAFRELYVSAWLEPDAPVPEHVSIISGRVTPVYFNNTVDHNGMVCLGSGLRRVTLGECSPVDAFWMTRFDELEVTPSIDDRCGIPVIGWLHCIA